MAKNMMFFAEKVCIKKIDARNVKLLDNENPNLIGTYVKHSDGVDCFIKEGNLMIWGEENSSVTITFPPWCERPAIHFS